MLAFLWLCRIDLSSARSVVFRAKRSSFSAEFQWFAPACRSDCDFESLKKSLDLSSSRWINFARLVSLGHSLLSLASNFRYFAKLSSTAPQLFQSDHRLCLFFCFDYYFYEWTWAQSRSPAKKCSPPDAHFKRKKVQKLARSGPLTLSSLDFDSDRVASSLNGDCRHRFFDCGYSVNYLSICVVASCSLLIEWMAWVCWALWRLILCQLLKAFTLFFAELQSSHHQRHFNSPIL